MGEYADIKRRRMLSLLRWLDLQSGFQIENGGKHQWLVKYATWERPFPIPFKHGTVNRYIVRELMKKVTETGACTKEQFDALIK